TSYRQLRQILAFPTRPSSDLLTYAIVDALTYASDHNVAIEAIVDALRDASDDNVDELKGFAESVLDGLRAAGFELRTRSAYPPRSEEHTSELQSRENLVCRLL